MKRLLAAFAGNTVFANILLVIILLAGWFATESMIRESMPEMALDMIRIVVSHPGADPEEIEEGISRKVEEVLKGLEGIKQFTTYSSENRGTTIIEVKQGYDADEVLEKIRSKIEAVSTFPVDSERPVIEEMAVQHQVLSLYLTGDMSERQLKAWAESIKDEVRDLPEVTQVSLFGTREYEINIEVSEERLQEYGLTFSQVTNAVRQSNMNLAGGTIRTVGEDIRIRTLGRKYTGQELSSIVVMARPEGEIITLDRLADIDDGFTEDPLSSKVDGDKAVILGVYNTQEEDALTISKAVKTYLDKKRLQLPEGTVIEIVYDDTDMLSARIDLLVRNGLIGLCIVFFFLWAFMDLRVSFWSGMGIPISIAGAMVVLWAVGGTLNMISLFAFIMVLGIVVDDAIVVGESIYFHRKKGEPPLKAAVEGVREVGLPVIAAVLTTIVAFLPLAYVGGIMGKFIYILPVVVIACLATSLVECLILLPAHLSHLPDPNGKGPKKKTNSIMFMIGAVQRFTSSGMEKFVERIYMPFLKKALRWRYISFCAAVTLFLLTLGLVQGGVIKYEMFPDVDEFVITSTLKFPEGTPQDITQDGVDQVEAALKRIGERTETISGAPLVEHSIGIVGQTLEMGSGKGPNLGAVQAILLPSEERGIHTKDLIVQWEKEMGSLPGVESLTFESGGHGPPGSPIEIWIQGEKMPVILEAADNIMDRLKRFDGVYQVGTDYSPGKNEMRLTLKPEARGFGLTVDDLARQVYAGYYGNEAVRLQRGQDDIRVKVRYTVEERSRISDLERVRIRTPNGYEVPLLSVAEISYEPGYSTITRTDGKRRVEVNAKIDTNKANASEIMGELSKGYLMELKKKYPDLSFSIQGDQKKSAESFGSLKISFPMAIIGIFIIIATMFRSYVQPFIILFTVPFGIIGGIIGHMLMGYNLSILSLFGMVALSGVVVNDAIVLIDRINRNFAKGMPFFDAIREGGARRFRAVFLTTISTVGGLTPLILETDFQARMLIPMAISIAAGVAFATILTLVLIPSLLAILNDFRLLIYRIKHGRWGTREEVEPAVSRQRDLIIDKQVPDAL